MRSTASAGQYAGAQPDFEPESKSGPGLRRESEPEAERTGVLGGLRVGHGVLLAHGARRRPPVHVLVSERVDLAGDGDGDGDERGRERGRA